MRLCLLQPLRRRLLECWGQRPALDMIPLCFKFPPSLPLCIAGQSLARGSGRFVNEASRKSKPHPVRTLLPSLEDHRLLLLLLLLPFGLPPNFPHARIRRTNSRRPISRFALERFGDPSSSRLGSHPPCSSL